MKLKSKFLIFVLVLALFFCLCLSLVLLPTKTFAADTCNVMSAPESWRDPAGIKQYPTWFDGPINQGAGDQAKKGCLVLGNFASIPNFSPTHALEVIGSAFIQGHLAVNQNLTVGGTINSTVVGNSDERLKQNISPLKNALSKLLNIRGVSFEWKDQNKPGQQVGVIAQEVEKEYPELVYTDAKGVKSVDYQRLFAVLAESAKELKAEIETVKAEIAEYRTSTN